MNGLKNPALRGSSSTNTKPYSCLNRARPNIFSIKSGLAYYDRDPSVGLLPLYQSSNTDRWISDGFEALVLAESAQQYVAIGATEIPAGKGIEFLTVLNSSVPGDLVKIRLAIASAVKSALRSTILFRNETFPERRNSSGKDTCARHKAGADLSEAVPEHRRTAKDGTCERETSTDRSEGDSSEEESKSRECIIHEKYIREIHQSIEEAGHLWVPDSEQIPSNLLFRVVRFGPAAFSNAVPSADLHPAPIPDLLQQRNLNVIVNHMYKQNKFSRAPFTDGFFAAFWPSCLDLDTTGATCNLCRCDTPPRRAQGHGHDCLLGGRLQPPWCLTPTAKIAQTDGPEIGQTDEMHKPITSRLGCIAGEPRCAMSDRGRARPRQVPHVVRPQLRRGAVRVERGRSRLLDQGAGGCR